MQANRRPQRVPTRFGRKTQFKVAPTFTSVAGEQIHTAFEELKTRLLRPALLEAPDSIVERQLRLAANEAAAVAWTTPFPLLVLPVLLEEKAADVHQRALRQAQVQEQTELLVPAGGE
jgi:hypothetical protein